MTATKVLVLTVILLSIQTFNIIAMDSPVNETKVAQVALSAGDEALFHAISIGSSLKDIKALMQKGANLNAQMLPSKNTPLNSAIGSNANLDVIEALITKENINLGQVVGQTPLHRAAANKNLAVIQLLKKYGADLNSQNNYKESPLHVALEEKANTQVVEALISPQNINQVQVVGMTPLHYAAAKETLDVIKLLIKNGAKLDMQTDSIETPLSKSLEANADIGVIETLITSQSVNLARPSGYTPLHAAVNRININAIELLIKHGANLNAQDLHKVTPLYTAIGKGLNTQVLQALITPQNINMGQAVGITPLHRAVYSKKIDEVNLLINNGANVNAQDNNQFTVLDYALKSTPANAEIIRKLIDSGARASTKQLENALIKYKNDDYIPKAIITSVWPEEVQHLVTSMLILTNPSKNAEIRDSLNLSGLTKDAADLISKQLVPVIVEDKLALARKYKLNVPVAELRPMIEANIKKAVARLPKLEKIVDQAVEQK